MEVYGLPVIESEAMPPGAPPMIVSRPSFTELAQAIWLLGQSGVSATQALANMARAFGIKRRRDPCAVWNEVGEAWEFVHFPWPRGPRYQRRALIPAATTMREELDR